MKTVLVGRAELRRMQQVRFLHCLLCSPSSAPYGFAFLHRLFQLACNCSLVERCRRSCSRALQMAKLRAVSMQIWRRCLLYETSRSHFKSLIFCAACAFLWLTSNCAGAYAGPGRERRRYIFHVFASAKGVLAALQLLCAPPRALRPQACQRHAAPAVSFHRRAP